MRTFSFVVKFIRFSAVVRLITLSLLAMTASFLLPLPVALAQGPTLTATNPTSNTVNAPLTSTVSITYNQPMSSTTVTSRTFAVHAMETGQLTQTLGVAGGKISLTPANPFKPGELVQASATTGTLNITGTAPLSPTVWQFFAAAGSGPATFPRGNNVGAPGDFTFSVAMGDVNGDGYLDVAVGNDGDPNVVYLNNGDGTFAASGNTFGTGTDNTAAVALGDVDGDGDLDVAVGNFGTQNAVYLNNGDGTFAASGNNFGPAVDYTLTLALGDVDGDGDLDVAVGNNNGQNVVYLNNGDGTFAAPGNKFGPTNDFTPSVTLGDVDGDGDLDAIVGNKGEQDKIYLNNGDGTFAAGGINFGTGTDDTWSVAPGDVDGDGDLDLVVGNYQGQNKTYLNNGSGTFTGGSNFGTGTDSTNSVALADVDGDGDLDVLAGNEGEINVVYFNNGSGSFSAGSEFGPANDWTYSVVPGDVDGDGDLDVAVGNYLGDQNVVYLNEPPPDVSIQKTVSPSAALPGETITYTLTFSNAGTGLATGVIISDSLPVSVTNASVLSSGVAITNTGTSPAYEWRTADLSPGQGGTITVTAVLSNPLAVSVFTNTATITASGEVTPANNSASAGVTVSNQTPVANAGTDQGVIQGVTVTLDGSGSSDANGDSLTYGWVQTGGSPGMTLSSSSAVSPTFTASDTGVFTFTLTVTDSFGLSSSGDTVRVTVSNQPPVANAGTPQNVTQGVTVTLDGSGSSDPDGHTPLTYGWTQTGGSPGMTLSSSSAVSPTFTASDTGVFTFTLTVTDSFGLSSSGDTVRVTVSNQPPVANAGTPQNVTQGATVTLDGSGSSDPDGHTPLTYGWTQTGGTPGMTLSSSSAVSPTFTASDTGVFTFTLTVTDSFGLSSSGDTVRVTVGNRLTYLPVVMKN